MIDTLRWLLPKAQHRRSLANMGCGPANMRYYHAPSGECRSVIGVRAVAEVLADISRSLPLVFPIHPRTKSRIEQFGLGHYLASAEGIAVLEPLGYLDFLALTSQAKVHCHRLGGTSGGVHCLGNTLPDASAEHRAPYHGYGGDEYTAGNAPDALRTCLQAVLDGIRTSEELVGTLGWPSRRANCCGAWPEAIPGERS